VRLRRRPIAIVAVLAIALASTAWAQADSPGELVKRWSASNATCRSSATPAADAVGACEQRDTLSKNLELANYCHGPADGRSGTTAWAPCSRNQRDQARARSMAPFQRVGGVFVLSTLLNGGTQTYVIVDSGAATVQIPEEVAEELKRNGTLVGSDFMGQHRFILADGRTMQQHVVRLRSLQVGDRVMENVLATIGAAKSRALLGQSFLRRLSWWKVDNVRNALEFEFAGPS